MLPAGSFIWSRRTQDSSTPPRSARFRPTQFVALFALAGAIAAGMYVRGLWHVFDLPIVESFEDSTVSPDGRLEAGTLVLDQGALGGSRHLIVKATNADTKVVLADGCWSTTFHASWKSSDRLSVSIESASAKCVSTGKDLKGDSFELEGRRILVTFVGDRPK